MKSFLKLSIQQSPSLRWWVRTTDWNRVAVPSLVFLAYLWANALVNVWTSSQIAGERFWPTFSQTSFLYPTAAIVIVLAIIIAGKILDRAKRDDANQEKFDANFRGHHLD